MKIWIFSYYEMFTVSIDGGSNITVECLSVLNVSLFSYIEHVHNPLERPMSYTPEIEECLENLDHSFGYSGVSVDILECPLNYRLEIREQPVPTDDPSLTRTIRWSLNT